MILVILTVRHIFLPYAKYGKKKKKKRLYDHHQSKEPRETHVIMFLWKLSILQYIWPTIRTLPCNSYLYKYVDVKKNK